MKKILNSEKIYNMFCKLDKLKCDFKDLLARFEAFILQYPQDLALKADLVGGKVPTSQLPSYVDDVITGTKMGATTFVDELTGASVPLERGKIYVDIPTGLVYRWTGTMFVEVSSSSSSVETPSAWTNINLGAPATANVARYRTKGDVVEVELYILRTNGRGLIHFGNIPASLRPIGFTDGFWVHGFNVLSKAPVAMRIDSANGNGNLSTIGDTGTDPLVFTFQYKRFQ